MTTEIQPNPDAANRTERVHPTGDFTHLSGNSRRGRVLVVDDESLVRWSLAETLGASGYDVTEADTAASALSAVLSSPETIRVVLLDLYLPDAHDLRVLRALRQVAPNTPLILMTAYGSPDLEAEAMRLGAFGVLDKPFELDAVLPLVERALAARRH